jgi:hypothetical protein
VVFTCDSCKIVIVLDINKYTLQDQVFLHESYVKFKAAEKCKRKVRRILPGA